MLGTYSITKPLSDYVNHLLCLMYMFKFSVSTGKNIIKSSVLIFCMDKDGWIYYIMKVSAGPLLLFTELGILLWCFYP